MHCCWTNFTYLGFPTAGWKCPDSLLERTDHPQYYPLLEHTLLLPASIRNCTDSPDDKQADEDEGSQSLSFIVPEARHDWLYPSHIWRRQRIGIPQQKSLARVCVEPDQRTDIAPRSSHGQSTSCSSTCTPQRRFLVIWRRRRWWRRPRWSSRKPKLWLRMSRAMRDTAPALPSTVSAFWMWKEETHAEKNMWLSLL